MVYRGRKDGERPKYVPGMIQVTFKNGVTEDEMREVLGRATLPTTALHLKIIYETAYVSGLESGVEDEMVAKVQQLKSDKVLSAERSSIKYAARPAH